MDILALALDDALFVSTVATLRERGVTTREKWMGVGQYICYRYCLPPVPETRK